MQGWLLTSWQGTEAIPQKIEFCHRRQPHLSTESHSRGHGCSASPGEGWDLSTYRPASCIGKTGGESAQTRIHSLVRNFVRHRPWTENDLGSLGLVSGAVDVVQRSEWP